MEEGRHPVNYAGLSRRDARSPRRGDQYRRLHGPPAATDSDLYQRNSPGIRPPFPPPRTPVPAKSPL